MGEGLPGWSPQDREHLGQELSDVLIYLVRLAEQCHVDLPEAVLRKLSLNAKKYPVHSSLGSSKKYNVLSYSDQPPGGATSTPLLPVSDGCGCIVTESEQTDDN